VQLDKSLSEEAIRRAVAQPLGLSLEEAAVSILKVANANMADAVRLVSIGRGYDPRDFVLVTFGGAGPLHGVALARDLSIPTVLVPPAPGVTSALGCLLVDIKHDISRMYLSAVEDVNPSDVETAFQELEEEGRQHLLHEGVPNELMSFQRNIDMRYLGQWRAMSIEVGENVTSLDAAVALFHKEHGREHNYSRLDAPVEVYRLTVNATGKTPKAEFAQHERVRSSPEPFTKRDVVFDEDPKAIMTPIYDRDKLKAGAVIDGPAIIEQLDSTILVPPGLKAKVDPSLTIVIDVPLAQG
jgi:N-methylhydantoinase A